MRSLWELSIFWKGWDQYGKDGICIHWSEKFACTKSCCYPTFIAQRWGMMLEIPVVYHPGMHQGAMNLQKIVTIFMTALAIFQKSLGPKCWLLSATASLPSTSCKPLYLYSSCISHQIKCTALYRMSLDSSWVYCSYLPSTVAPLLRPWTYFCLQVPSVSTSACFCSLASSLSSPVSCIKLTN